MNELMMAQVPEICLGLTQFVSLCVWLSLCAAHCSWKFIFMNSLRLKMQVFVFREGLLFVLWDLGKQTVWYHLEYILCICGSVQYGDLDWNPQKGPAHGYTHSRMGFFPLYQFCLVSVPLPLEGGGGLTLRKCPLGAPVPVGRTPTRSHHWWVQALTCGYLCGSEVPQTLPTALFFCWV